MASKKAIPINFKDLSGGLNSKDSDSRLADNEATELINFEFSADGSLKKRSGTARYNSSSLGTNPIVSLYRFYKSATVFKEMLCVYDTGLYKGNDGTGVWTSIKSGLTAGKPCSFATWGDICYIWNGYDTPMQYDGTSVTNTSGTPPQGKYVVFRKDRLYVAGDPSNPNRLYFSETGDPTTWDAGTNYIDVRSNDGDKITGILPLGDILVIYKNNSVWILAGTSSSDFFLSPRVEDIGCMASYSLVAKENVHFFLHRTGVYTFNGATVQKLSEKVTPEIEGIPSSYLENAAGVIYKTYYFISYARTGQTINDRILVFDFRNQGRWTQYKGLSFRCFIIWAGSADSGEIYASGAVNGNVWKFNTGTTDDGADIETVFKSKTHDLGQPHTTKLIRYISVTGLRGVILQVLIIPDWGEKTVTRVFNFAAIGALWDTGLWDTAKWGGGDIASLKASISPILGQEIAVKITETSDKEYSLYGWGIEVIPKKYRRLT